MEYLIAGIVTFAFFTLYLIGKSKQREEFSKLLSDEKYVIKLKKIADFQAVKSGNLTYDVKPFYKKIKKARKLAEKSDCDELKILSELLKQVEKHAKGVKNCDDISDLPCIKNLSRMEIIAKTALSSCEFNIIEDKIATAFETFNKISTVTFDEIKIADKVFEYVLLEKAGFLASRVLTIEKIRKIAEKISKNPKKYEKSKIYRILKDNNVFLHFSSSFRGEVTPSADAVYFDVAYSTRRILSSIADSLERLSAFSFYRFYRPLEILHSYDVFRESGADEKISFMTELCRQSTKLNIDEYVYALTIENYLNRAVPTPIGAKKIQTPESAVYVFRQKRNLIMLCRALSSREMTSLFFKNPRKNQNSILKSALFKNTFAPFTSKNTLKFGVSILGDNLFLEPSISSEFEKIDLDFSHDGVKHHVTILPSCVETLSVNGTKMKGIPCVKLGKTPLVVELKTPFKN